MFQSESSAYRVPHKKEKEESMYCIVLCMYYVPNYLKPRMGNLPSGGGTCLWANAFGHIRESIKT